VAGCRTGKPAADGKRPEHAPFGIQAVRLF
jgi:hypothetical protein